MTRMRLPGSRSPSLSLVRVVTVVAILALAAALTVWCSREFAALEPRQDHAWFTQWVRALLETERIFPRWTGDEGWRAALEADERSALHVLLRQLYTVPFAVINLGALAWYVIFGLLLGASMPAQIAISALALALASAALALFALRIGSRSDSPAGAALFAGLTFAFAAGSSFLHVFSALGPHNVAILMLALLVAASERWLGALQADGSRRHWGAGLAVLLLYSLTLYTYQGGTMLAPPVLALTILAAPRLPLTTRLKWVIGLVLWTVVVILPLGTVAWLGQQPGYAGASNQGIVHYALLAVSGGDYAGAATPLLERARIWFTSQSAIFTPAGLVLGLGGLIGLAVRERVRAPLILALVHLALGIVVPYFSQYDRTSAYLLPFLCLGAAWAVATPIMMLIARPAGRRVSAAMMTGVVLALAIVHVAVEAPRLAKPGRVAGWQTYLARQGDWTPTQREIEARLPSSAALIPWDYQVSHLYNSLRAADGTGPRLYVPLSTLRDRQADGSLADYLVRRRLTLSESDGGLFLLAPATEAPETLAPLLTGLGLTAAPPRIVARWDDRRWPLNYPSLVLYELRSRP